MATKDASLINRRQDMPDSKQVLARSLRPNQRGHAHQVLANAHMKQHLEPHGPSAKNKKLFPQKLWDLVNDRRYSFCLRWSEDGQLVYLNRDEFEDSYLRTADNQFHTQKAISFVRQMNMYGFKKVDDCYYENDNFKRDCKHLLKNMIRKHTNKGPSLVQGSNHELANVPNSFRGSSQASKLHSGTSLLQPLLMTPTSPSQSSSSPLEIFQHHQRDQHLIHYQQQHNQFGPNLHQPTNSSATSQLESQLKAMIRKHANTSPSPNVSHELAIYKAAIPDAKQHGSGTSLLQPLPPPPPPSQSASPLDFVQQNQNLIQQHTGLNQQQLSEALNLTAAQLDNQPDGFVEPTNLLLNVFFLCKFYISLFEQK